MLLAKITIHITVSVPFGIAYCMNSIDSLARTPIENNVFKVSLVKSAKKKLVYQTEKIANYIRL